MGKCELLRPVRARLILNTCSGILVGREVIVTMTLAAGLIPMRSADKTDRLV
jgi:hypothetical protein